MALKKEALRAIGLIGDKRALPHLMKLASKRQWFAAKRSEELRVFAIGIIGQMGDESSLDFLQMTGAKGSPIGRASKAAAASISQRSATNL